ncbi:MAG: hypothetical protein H7X97_06255 [Opitutaceae bacterium]|nr:hypothetical protein [Verrucomicrobiales bacterium]
MIRRLIKWMIYLLLGVVLLIVVAILSMDSIVRALTEKRIRDTTGMDVKIGKLSVGLASPGLTIEDFVLYNTSEFGGGPLVNMPELRLIIDSEAARAGKLKFTLVRLNLAEVSVVTDKKGRINLDQLKEIQAAENKKSGKTNQVGNFEFAGVDTLNVTLGRARFINLADPRLNRDVKFGIDHQVFKDIKTMLDLETVAYALAMRSGASFLLTPPGKPIPKPAPAPRVTNAPSNVISAEAPALPRRK